MSVSPSEYETDVYQGLEAKFGIVMETSGLELKNVHLYVVEYATLTYPPVNPIPAGWISFDKNNFDVPAEGKVTVNCTIRIPKSCRC